MDSEKHREGRRRTKWERTTAERRRAKADLNPVVPENPQANLCQSERGDSKAVTGKSKFPASTTWLPHLGGLQEGTKAQAVHFHSFCLLHILL